MSPAGGPTDTVAFGPVRVSRLIVGHNHVCGNSHVSEATDADMRAYFTPENTVAMYRRAAIARDGKPVLAFKILAASRKCATQDDVRAAYRFAYAHIRPTDAVAVGFFPRDLDQVHLGVEYAREACGGTAR